MFQVLSFSRLSIILELVNSRDTVSSIGITREERPGTSDVNENTCYTRHLVAADECRVKFGPEYACGGESVIQGPLILDSSGMKDPMIPRLTEVWFPGSHADMYVCIPFAAVPFLS